MDILNLSPLMQPEALFCPLTHLFQMQICRHNLQILVSITLSNILFRKVLLYTMKYYK
ncbi:hypothetical protein HanPSC8_Chr07g0291341 [Helianthus annuus]|nr:hypothetical protein HanPSC8_Chr07g0291341 [Helianthus annuus]